MNPSQELTLIQLRKASPYTVKNVAEHMGVSRRTINHWEKGQREISASKLWRLWSFYVRTDIPISQIPVLIPTFTTTPTYTSSPAN